MGIIFSFRFSSKIIEPDEILEVIQLPIQQVDVDSVIKIYVHSGSCS